MSLRFLQPVLPFLALPLLAASALGQTTGVSHPDDGSDETSVSAPAPAADHYVMPSRSAVPATAPAAQAQSYPATAPISETSYPATATAAPATAEIAPAQPPAPALIVRQPAPPAAPGSTPETAFQTAEYQPDGPVVHERPGTDDGVVEVRLVPHQLNEGVVLTTRLVQQLSTETTQRGARFSAQLLTDAGHSGEVLLPAGSVLHGRVTEVHGGARITGGASIRLQADSVTLPDGTTYPLSASVSGVRSLEDQHVNAEGAIQPDSHPKETAAAIGGVTGAGAIMGAAIGGGVGAGVGALVGASAGAIFWLKRDHQETLPSGTSIAFSLDQPFQLNPR